MKNGTENSKINLEELIVRVEYGFIFHDWRGVYLIFKWKYGRRVVYICICRTESRKDILGPTTSIVSTSADWQIVCTLKL